MEKHDTLLLSCSDQENRRILRELFQSRYHLLEAATISQTKLLLQYNIDCICAVLVDASLRQLEDKRELLREETYALLSQVPVVVICSKHTTGQEKDSFLRYGAADVLSLDDDSNTLVRRVDTIAELHRCRHKLETVAQEKADMLRLSSYGMVDALSTIVEYRSQESGNHILRVRHFTRILLECVKERCPEYGLTDRLVPLISSAAALHDIGKIAIPDAILMKPDALTPEEREIVKTHSITGCQILNNLKGAVEEEYLHYAYNICHYHHERWDGQGSPEGLMGDEIPICAQVVGLVDSYDALTSTRAYKEPYSHAQAMNMILRGECGAFSPKLLECFKEVTDALEALNQEYADGRDPKEEVFDPELAQPSRETENAMDWMRAIYYCLVHYIDAFMVEVDLDRELFHVVYNPYPELASLDGVNDLKGLYRMMLERIIVPQEQAEMHRLLTEELPRFVEEDLRRATRIFHYRNQEGAFGGAFEMTLLRAGNTRRTMAILCRKLSEEPQAAQSCLQKVTLPIGAYLCRNDRNFTLVRMEEHSLDLGGYTPQELRQELGGCLMGLVHPEDRQWVRQEYDRQLQKGVEVTLEHRVVYKQGQVVWVSNKGRLITDSDGQEYLFCSVFDISPSRQAIQALEERIHRYQEILTRTEHVLFDWNMQTDTLEFSENWERLFGRETRLDNVRSMIDHGAFFHPDDTPLLLDCISNLENGSEYEMAEARLVTRRGRYLWCRFRASASRDEAGRLLKIMGILINIDAEKQAQWALLDQAQRDGLTKLLNKAASRKQAERYLARFPKGIPCALLILDLDDFKQVNDQFGHLFGDAVLTKTADAIEKHFESQDIIARIGGDEFMVLVRGTADRNLLESRCRSLLDMIRTSVGSVHKKIRVSCSIGIALGPSHGKNYFELFSHADQALYGAKALGKNTFCFYDPALPEQAYTGNTTPIDSETEPGLAEDNSFARFAFRKLYSARDVEAAVNEVIGLLGKNMNVSRVYIFENSLDNRYCSNTFEWCNEGISPEIQDLQNLSYERDIVGYADNFNEEGIFYCPDIRELPPKTYEIVEAQGIQSMLQCAIRQDGVFRGYIGFDECEAQRLWTKEEISMLTYFSDVLAVFLLKHREQERTKAQAMEINSILENQDNWVYVVEPDTMKLKYMNKRVRRDSPEARVGQTCYQALLGQTAQCPNCPTIGLEPGVTGRKCSLDVRYQSMMMLAEASIIQWQGEKSCYVNCRELPREILK